jgi:hypothetical protein
VRRGSSGGLGCGGKKARIVATKHSNLLGLLRLQDGVCESRLSRACKRRLEVAAAARIDETSMLDRIRFKDAAMTNRNENKIIWLTESAEMLDSNSTGIGNCRRKPY